MFFQISIKSSLVLLVILCCSLHTLNARSLRVLHEESTAKELNRKKNMMSNQTRVSLPSDMKSLVLDDKFKVIKSELNKSRNDTPNKGNKVKVKSTTEKNEQHHHRTSQATVSWRVLRKKRGEKDAGFNLDYLPPKTHPPAHN